jgi:hypothetical protein
LAACDKPAPPIATAPAAVFTLTDSSTGHALLRRDGSVIDTADITFGMHVVGRDSVLYMPASTDSIAAVPVLFHDGTRTSIDSFVPDYDARYATPSVIANAVLYWGIHTTNGVDSVRAVRYEFGRKRLNELPVSAKLDRTNPTYHFMTPFLDGKEIVFKAPDGEWRFRTPKQ